MCIGKGNYFCSGVYKNIKGWCNMIKPLKNISNTSFKANGLENYKNSVKDHQTPKYQALARADE